MMVTLSYGQTRRGLTSGRGTGEGEYLFLNIKQKQKKIRWGEALEGIMARIELAR
jgi:hypothetical protein